MGWLKALFDRSEDGTREYIRLLYKRNLSRSSGHSTFERAISAATATLEARYASLGVEGFGIERCMFEAMPFAFLADDTPDALAEYVHVRENLNSDQAEWLHYQANKGLDVLLESDDPSVERMREWFMEAYPTGFALWKMWINDANQARLTELQSN